MNWDDYRGGIQEHGRLVATRWLIRSVWSRIVVTFANRFLPYRVSCPCCGWRGSRFDDYLEIALTIRNIACPRCDSHPRHRALFLWLSREHPLADKPGVALVFGPERALDPIWEAAVSLCVYRVDVSSRRGPDFLADLRQMPVATDSIDLMWCHHVLEHIDNDEAAIAELHRMLRPGTGELFVSVPMKVGTTTQEYGFANKRESGHWRIYGDDFIKRLSDSGLIVKVIPQNFSSADRVTYGLSHDEFYVCQKPLRQTG